PDLLCLDGDVYLQEMAEDEEIDLYNEETFGIDIDSSGDLPEDLYLLCEALGAHTPQGATLASSGDKKPPEAPVSEPEREGPSHEEPGAQAEADEEGQSWAQSPSEGRPWDLLDEALPEQKPGVSDGELRDPAIMKLVHGKPTLESLDSAIVDSGSCSSWNGLSITEVLILAVCAAVCLSVSLH
ncbi:protein PAT1 homolog 2-like, partial [Mustelus asterias]